MSRWSVVPASARKAERARVSGAAGRARGSATLPVGRYGDGRAVAVIGRATAGAARGSVSSGP